MESICEIKILNVPNILLHSKSDDWKIFNNFGRSMFAGLVERLLHVNFAILKNWYIDKFVCLILSWFAEFSRFQRPQFRVIYSNMIPLFEFRIVDSYLPDLVLQGVQENDFRGRLSADLKLALQVSSMIIPIFAHHHSYV